MKLSTKIILPIILISAFLILLAGCFGVPDDSPAYTPGSIQGIMARPEECCYAPETELAGDPISPNVCDVEWYAWANVKVVLSTWVDSVEIEIAETDTDENGAYLFSDVPPAKNYIITAICPTDKKFVIKDVAEEVVGGETYDAGIADAESTVLALCLEGLGEIGDDSYLLDLTVFQEHSDYNKVIKEVCDYLANCEHAISSWVSVLTGLSPGFTEDTGDTGGGGAFIGGGGAAPAAVSHTLTVTIDGDGSVTVDGNVYTVPVTVDEGTVLALVATPASGWQFDGWSGDASASPVIMDADKEVTATFSEIPTPQYTLTINYKYEDNSPAEASYVDATLNAGVPYDVDSPYIPGYTTDQPNVSGIMPADNVTVKVVYTVAIISPEDSSMTKDSGLNRIRLALIDQNGSRIPGDTLELEEFDRGSGPVPFGAWEVLQGAVVRNITAINYGTVGANWDVEIFVDVLTGGTKPTVKYYGYDLTDPVIIN